MPLCFWKRYFAEKTTFLGWKMKQTHELHEKLKKYNWIIHRIQFYWCFFSSESCWCVFTLCTWNASFPVGSKLEERSNWSKAKTSNSPWQRTVQPALITLSFFGFGNSGFYWRKECQQRHSNPNIKRRSTFPKAGISWYSDSLLALPTQPSSYLQQFQQLNVPRISRQISVTEKLNPNQLAML